MLRRSARLLLLYLLGLLLVWGWSLSHLLGGTATRDNLALVLVDRFDPSLIDWLKGRERQNLFVYAWAPGQILQHLDGSHVDVRAVRDTLVKRFQQ